MRKWLLACAGVLVLSLVWFGGMLMNTNWKPRSLVSLFPPGKVLNVGHRGGSALAPENTMHAFQAAKQAGVDGVEFDVMMTRDGKIVVFHDYKLEKRLYATGDVRKMTYAQLQKVDVSPYYVEHHPFGAVPKAFRPTRVPLLSEVLAFYQPQPNVVLNIELKNEDVTGKGLEPAVAAMIRKFGVEKRVIVSSFNPFALWRFRKVAPSIPRGLIYSGSNPIYIRNLWFLNLARPDALHPHYELVTKEYMARAKKRGFAVNPWTVNHAEQMKRLQALGVNSMITDEPVQLGKILKKSRK